MTLLSPKVRSWIGREATYTSPEPLDAAAFRLFALALGDPNPRWAAGEAPPTFLFESNRHLSSAEQLRAGGHIWQLPVPGCRVIRGGHEYELHRPPRVGDVLTVSWRLAGIEEKTSRSGGSFLLVRSEVAYRDQAGELLGRQVETLIYQPVPPSAG